MNEVIDENGKWNYEKLISLVPTNIATSFYQSFLPSNPQFDAPVWSLSSNGEYYVKSGYWFTQGLLNPNFTKVDHNWIWKLKVPPNITNFLWKACHDGLPAKDRLEKKSKVFLLQ